MPPPAIRIARDAWKSRSFILGALFLAGICVGSAGADLPDARAALEHNDFNAAVSIAERILSKHADNPEAWIVLGHALSGEIDDANIFRKIDLARRSLAAYRRAAEIAPRNREACISLVEFYRQAPAIVGGGWQKAFNQALILVPLDAGWGYASLARLSVDKGDYENALKYCIQLGQVEPHSYRFYFWSGISSMNAEKDPVLAVNFFRQAVLLSPGPQDPELDEANLNLGRALEKLGDKAGAVAAYRAALVQNPKQTDAQRRLAHLK